MYKWSNIPATLLYNVYIQLFKYSFFRFHILVVETLHVRVPQFNFCVWWYMSYESGCLPLKGFPKAFKSFCRTFSGEKWAKPHFFLLHYVWVHLLNTVKGKSIPRYSLLEQLEIHTGGKTQLACSVSHGQTHISVHRFLPHNYIRISCRTYRMGECHW
jgi:hypothetical protein